MAIGSSSFQTLYQTYYPDSELKYLTPTGAVLLNMALGNTDTQISGDIVDMPWLLDGPGGGSQSYTVAANNANLAPTSLRPTVRMSQYYKNVSFLDKDQVLSQGVASYGPLMETTIKGMRLNVLNDFDTLLHGNGSGNVGAFTWASATPTVLTFVTAPTTLTSDSTGAALGAPVGQVALKNGYKVVITSTNPKDGSVPTIVSGPYSITGVTPSANSITISSTPAADLSNGNTYGIAIQGNTLGFQTANLNPAVIGVAAFNPYGGPASTDSFCGVNRYNYGPGAYGSWIDASSNYTFEQAIMVTATQMTNSGVLPEGATACLSPNDHDTLNFKLTSQNRYTQHKLGEVFFDAMAINSSLGRLNVVCDTKQERGYVRIYAPGAMKLMYRGGMPHFATLDGGLDEQWGANYDGREKRMRIYAQTFVEDPRKFGVGKLPVGL